MGQSRSFGPKTCDGEAFSEAEPRPENVHAAFTKRPSAASPISEMGSDASVVHHPPFTDVATLSPAQFHFTSVPSSFDESES